MSRLTKPLEIGSVAARRFIAHDGWAIASHIALSILIALFPFLILLAALAGLFGTKSLADEAGVLIFDAWPREIAKPVVNEMHRVLTEQRGGVLTVGAVLALYFSSAGVESLRVGLNRAYGLREQRPWWLTRLESIAYVICGALAMLAFALLVVLGPLIWRNVINVAPGLEPLSLTVAIGRIGITAFLLVSVLVIAHKFIATGRRSFLAVIPGVAVTLLLWFLAGLGFGYYLDRFSNAYVSTYGSLATAMVALVFLYWLAAMFLFGGEINGTVIAARRVRLQARMREKQARAHGL
ncbi:ribonuclease BN [Methylobacterium sp. Leaf102]|uniref:YihY/virulence factor BrkB family protein n=1 Tax=unclassified Methylobacterium TaxID=2615210 RepID=UPI0006F5D87E|nr:MULTISPECIES: YihY/virulence factor BrkB family protein [unclassified Methylobacterium]USU30794.1 YihY/virulence factor BrkB family protein [Methylobacterium sp. OTU13CASTA1]KQO72542.1 ribonuclease BN [Methylobacterium sp. Leaf87]KQP24165.1 ribonuclease BN [Methylobacterium sp. Leaf100]KQP24497.1 ribonuclease BN [Methylobacterium sp. Leaf102]KQP60295.1 ribonuclease BN [Methylobacterium sp. Leaf112]